VIAARIKSFIAHYAYGLFAAGWNGAWQSVASILGIDAMAMTGAIQDAHLLNGKEMLGAYIGGFAIHVVLWVVKHPLPAELPVSDPVSSP
jgi:hypothetical protein